MGLFGSRVKTIALVDIGSSSIGGGYVTIGKDGTPRLHYTTRVPIELHDRSLAGFDMLKALSTLGSKLLNEGSPKLRKEMGSARIEQVIVSIGSPWQETSIRTEVIEKDKPFTFTKAILTEASTHQNIPEGRFSSGELVVATLLNGYNIKNPFGKKADRAELIILSSTLEGSTVEGLRDTFSHLYHTKDIEVSAFAPIAFTVLRDLYPHEKDFLIMHVSGETTDLALVKSGILVDVASLTAGVNGIARAARKGEPLSMEVPGGATDAARKEWIDGLAATLRTFSSSRALPRTVFLLADADVRDYFAHVLDDQALHSLWLSDEPLTIIPSIPQHLSSYVTCDEGCEKDLFLSMLALSVSRETGIEPL